MPEVVILWTVSAYVITWGSAKPIDHLLVMVASLSNRTLAIGMSDLSSLAISMNSGGRPVLVINHRLPGVFCDTYWRSCNESTE